MEQEIIQSTQELLKIKSVKDKPLKGKPFGEGIDNALQYALSLGEKFGFDVKNVDGYAGHADFGSGEEIVGVLVHLDIVPEGSGWTYPPFGAEIHDGKIFARGAIDDKGPAVAILYAMKAIKDLKIQLNKRIRVIFGTDEESNWGCMDYYFKKEKAPACAFSPDADFPVIYGEKGIAVYELIKDFKEATEDGGLRVIKIKGGSRPNMVPDYCEAYLKTTVKELEKVRIELEKALSTTGLSMDIEEIDNIFIIKSYGVSAHASTPEQGKNAISQLMIFLNKLKLKSTDVSDFIQFYVEKIGDEVHGKSLGCGFEDGPSGKLTLNVGIIDLDEKMGKVTLDIRYPITYLLEDIHHAMHQSLIEYGIAAQAVDHIKPINLPKEHELIQKLIKVYRDITGDMREPLTIGGGTYARAIDNAVAFGPAFPGQPEVAHQKDEYIAIDHLMQIINIYAQALYELAK